MYRLKCSYTGAPPVASSLQAQVLQWYSLEDIKRNSTGPRSIYVTKRFGFVAADLCVRSPHQRHMQPAAALRSLSTF